MATTIEQQVALDEALVPNIQRLRIRRSNFRLPSDIQSKESTLQVVYDVLRRCPFFKAFLVTADVPEIYMQEFWAIAYVNQYSIIFKIDRKKNIVDLETFRDMLHICPRVPGQSFDELPFKEEILDFLWFLGHNAQIKTLTDNTRIKRRVMRCITQDSQKSSSIIHDEETFYPKTKQEYYACAIREATPKPKASARRKRSGSDTSITPPTAITTPTTTVVAAPRLTAAVKGKQPAKAKSPTDPSEVARTETEPLKIVLRRSRQESHISQLGGSSRDKGIGSKPGVPDVPSDDLKDDISWNSLDDEDVDAQDKDRNDDEGDKKDESNDGKEDDDDDDKDGAERDDDDDDDDDEEEISKIDEPEDTKSGGGDDEETKSDEESDEEETREEEEESFDPIPRTPEDSEDDGNGEEDQGLRVSEEQRLIEEEEADEIYRDININQGRGLQLSQDIEDSYVTLTPVNPDGQQESSSVSSHFVSSMLNPISDAGMESIFTTASSSIAPLQTPTPIMTPSTVATITTISHALIPPMTIPSEDLQNLPTFDSVFHFQDRLKSLEVHFSEFIQTNQFAEAVSNIPVAADLSEMELKKILIEKMEGNKSIQRSDEQRNLYKALVDAYEADKTILDSYGETAILKRRREDDDQEGPSAGSDRGSTTGTQSRKMLASKSAFAEEPVQTTSQMDEPSYLPKKPPTPNRDWNKTLPAAQGSTQLWISDLAKQADSRSSFNELLDTPLDFSNFIMNRLEVDTLTLELLAGPTYELMRGSCNSLTELEYHLEEVYKVTTDQLDWVNPEGQQYPHNLLQSLPLILDNRGRRVIPFAHFINNDLEYLRGGASSRKYTTFVTKTKAADYGHIK
uniref:Uncharacterized protein n=1 Tax=Tanacetum cinerariifolium TaxID=118510 RepID=A0A6L2LN23_TANCI|nr:hypothetical protein [Tanacetum cinerariifolium]